MIINLFYYPQNVVENFVPWSCEERHAGKSGTEFYSSGTRPAQIYKVGYFCSIYL